MNGYPLANTISNDAAKTLSTVSVIYGKATSASVDGRVTLMIDGVPVKDVATGVRVAEGDTVSISVVNHHMQVVAVVGRGDEEHTAILEAAATATSYIEHEPDGVVIGYKLEDGSWSGYRAKIYADRYAILDENGIEVSHFGSTSANIGAWPADPHVGDSATLSFMNGAGQLNFEIGGVRDITKLISGAVILDGYDVALKAEHLTLEASISATLQNGEYFGNLANWIIESSVSPDGWSVVKYANGDMIIRKKHLTEYSCNIVWHPGLFYRSDISNNLSFPTAFIAAPQVHMWLTPFASGSDGNMLNINSGPTTTKTGASFIYKLTQGVPPTTQSHLNIIAIGKWK